MTKIYEVEIVSNRYSGQMPRREQYVAASCGLALQKAKKDVAWHEEITRVELVAKAER